ncbi:MAG: DUF3386 family protein [Gemmataceae bacterium]|nr:DUF3386 family protein [Gemmataceae bacterium]
MTPRRLFLLSLVASLLTGADAGAHFLFVHIRPAAEAGRAAEVFFSEQAEAGDPRFIDKIAHTRLWVQTAPGQFRDLKVHKAADRLRAAVPVSGSIAVVGICEYGVLGRAKTTPFLLRHFPKAVSGDPEELNRMQPRDNLPLEVTARFEGDRIHFTALRQGKPLPGAVFYTVGSDLKGGKHTADREGRVTWQPPRPGNYSVYTSHWFKSAGDFGGKKYGEIRDFATLAFRWPLAPQGADPKAVALFEEALAARARWEKFAGFEARIKGTVDGRPFKGTVTVDAKGEVEVEIDDEVLQPWVQEQLESIVLHRASGPRAEGQAKPVLRFADFDMDHPLGRLVAFEGGRFASSYRIKDRQLMTVNRHVGKQYMTITVLDNDRTPEGRFLPRSYTVQYWDAVSGELRRSETVRQRWQRVGSLDLPAEHIVTTAADGGLSVRHFTLTDHRLPRPK